MESMKFTWLHKAYHSIVMPYGFVGAMKVFNTILKPPFVGFQDWFEEGFTLVVYVDETLLVGATSLIPSARQPGIDFFVTCVFIITIILYPHLNNISSKLCGDLNLNKSISTSSKSNVSTAALVKDCKVVLEDISSYDAVKLKMLNTSQENTHMTSSHLTKEKKLLEHFSVKAPIA